MAAIKVDIPEDLIELLKGSRLGERPLADQVRVVLAIHLFQEGVISVGRAAEIAAEPRASFELLLAEMGIPPARFELEDYLRDGEAIKQALERG